jgi:hypothetical protein
LNGFAQTDFCERLESALAQGEIHGWSPFALLGTSVTAPFENVDLMAAPGQMDCQ